RAREQDGWTSSLIDRALAACRIIAGYAMERPATQRQLSEEAADYDEGALRLERRWTTNGDGVLIFGSATPQTIALALANGTRRSERSRVRLEQLLGTLAALTRARYAGATTVDTAELDGTFSVSEDAARRLAVEHTWWMKRARSLARRGR